MRFGNSIGIYPCVISAAYISDKASFWSLKGAFVCVEGRCDNANLYHVATEFLLAKFKRGN